MNKQDLRKKIAKDIEEYLKSGKKINEWKDTPEAIKKANRLKYNQYSFNTHIHGNYQKGSVKSKNDERFRCNYAI